MNYLQQLRAALTGVTGVVRRASWRRSRVATERPSWLPARETDVAAAAAASALNPRAPLASFRSTPPKREVVLEMSPVTVPVPAVPQVEPVYDPVPQPRPLKPDEDKAVKDNKANVCQGPEAGQAAMGTAAYVLQDLTDGVAVKPPPPPPLPIRGISDSTLL